MDKQEVFKETKKVDVINVNPSQYGTHYRLSSTDGVFFSTFDKSAGEQLTGISDGDIVEIEYFVNAKGFKTFTSIKLVENDKELQEKTPEKEGVEKPHFQKRSVDRLDKNSISAGQIALSLMAFMDFTKFTEEQIVEKFRTLWELIEGEINK